MPRMNREGFAASPADSDARAARGLRADKRRRTRDRILANAIALFRAQGVRPTRLAQIAEAGDVSVATLFNYFPTKGALAEAWVRGELEARLAESIEAAVDTRHSLRSAIRAACRDLAEASAAEPALRLDAWREAGRARRDGFVATPGRVSHGTAFVATPGRVSHGRAFVATPGRVSHRAALVAGVREEQARDHLRGDLPATTLAELLLDAIEGGLIAGLEADAGEAEVGPEQERARALGRSARERVDLVLDGARKRNERVRPPTSRG